MSTRSNTSPGRKAQLGLALKQKCGWGGKRRGAGRPRKQARRGVPHRARPPLAGARHPAHVTLRVREHVWNLRSRRCFDIVETALSAIAARSDFRVVHFSVQGNHIHAIVEADDAGALSAGAKAIAVRIARGLNRLMGRRGAVFSDRYHAHALRTPREVRNAIAYVLLNHRSHLARAGERLGAAGVDPYSSAPSSDVWARAIALPHHAAMHTDRAGTVRTWRATGARTWLLGVGWRRCGLIQVDEVPAMPPHVR